MDTLLCFSDPAFRDGYDVKRAVVLDHRDLGELDKKLRGEDLLKDDLLADTIAAMNRRWPAPLEELRAGAVVGMHGSVRRFGPQVHYASWRAGLVDLPRDAWLAQAQAIVEARHDRDRLLAYRRIGKQYAYEAFQKSPQPEQLASALSQLLTARLRQASHFASEHRALLDDLATLGHPFWLWDDGENREGWEGYYAYAAQAPGEPRRRMGLRMTIAYGKGMPADEIRVEFEVTDPGEEPPGFPAG